MKIFTKVVSAAALLVLLLTACSGGIQTTLQPATPRAETSVPVTPSKEATKAASNTTAIPEATMMPRSEATQEANPGIPITGNAEDPARLSNQLDFNLYSESGKQIGQVDNIILDLGKEWVSYVIVEPDASLGAGGKYIPVPWEFLKVHKQTDNTNASQYVFVLKGVDQDVFINAPGIDVNSDLPAPGNVSPDWDARFRSYWQSKSNSTNVQPAQGGTQPTETAMAQPPAETQTPPTTTNPGLNLGGVILAKDILGRALNLSDLPIQGNLDVSIDDMIVDTDTGQIKYVIVHSNQDPSNELRIPVPIRLLSWNPNNQTFTLNTNLATLQNAPSYQAGQYLDTLINGWDKIYQNYWQGH